MTSHNLTSLKRYHIGKVYRRNNPQKRKVNLIIHNKLYLVKKYIKDSQI